MSTTSKQHHTWVLILAPNGNDKWPAVIGGYRSREEAENAGMEAIEPPQEKVLREMNEEEKRAWYIKNGFGYTWCPVWESYTVIPGAAVSEPEPENEAT